MIKITQSINTVKIRKERRRKENDREPRPTTRRLIPGIRPILMVEKIVRWKNLNFFKTIEMHKCEIEKNGLT